MFHQRGSEHMIYTTRKWENLYQTCVSVEAFRHPPTTVRGPPRFPDPPGVLVGPVADSGWRNWRSPRSGRSDRPDAPTGSGPGCSTRGGGRMPAAARCRPLVQVVSRVVPCCRGVFLVRRFHPAGPGKRRAANGGWSRTVADTPEPAQNHPFRAVKAVSLPTGTCSIACVDCVCRPCLRSPELIRSSPARALRRSCGHRPAPPS